jgi:hypothetical protein
MKPSLPFLGTLGLCAASSLFVAPAQAASVFAQWNFNDSANGATSVASIGGYTGTFENTAGRSADGSGVSGVIGDYAYSPGGNTGRLTSNSAGFLADLNTLTGGQKMSITFWQNLNGTPSSTAFWGNSPGATGTNRGMSAHTPWSDGNTYFDTSGCCGGETRVSGALGATVGTWEMMTFVYDSGSKAVYRNNTLITSGVGATPLLTNLDAFFIGNAANGTEGMDARIDNFTIWNGALTTEEIAALVPEPTTGLLGLAGTLALAFRRRRTL